MFPSYLLLSGNISQLIILFTTHSNPRPADETPLYLINRLATSSELVTRSFFFSLTQYATSSLVAWLLCWALSLRTPSTRYIPTPTPSRCRLWHRGSRKRYDKFFSTYCTLEVKYIFSQKKIYSVAGFFVELFEINIFIIHFIPRSQLKCFSQRIPECLIFVLFTWHL